MLIVFIIASIIIALWGIFAMLDDIELYGDSTSKFLLVVAKIIEIAVFEMVLWQFYFEKIRG
jgi:ABC-type Mn2+/Zn2+ transport system permease subunit